jgi:ABC-type dipeptide/oligopeptide/nickel transport system permease subunit
VNEGAQSAIPPEAVGLGVARLGPWRQAAARFRRRPLGLVAVLALVVLVAIGALAGVFAPYYPGQEFIQLIGRPQPPLTAHHLLGTDTLGRDFFTQLLFSIRETVLSALVCAGGAVAIGVAVGAPAGYFGGRLDELVTWATRVVVAVPAIAVLIVIAVWHRLPLTPLDDGLWLMALLWTGVARVARATVASLRVNEYVEAAEASGASGLRLLVRHLLPNATGPIIVAGTNLVGQSIAIIATVDYLGYGYNQPERPTLGGLVADAARSSSQSLGQAASVASVWWLYLIPAGLLVGSLLAIAFLGDVLDDSLNPTSPG